MHFRSDQMHCAPAYGLYVRHAAGLTLRDFRIVTRTADARPALHLDDTENVRLDGFTVSNSTECETIISCRNTRRAQFSGCSSLHHARQFFRFEDRCRRISLIGNDFSDAERP